MLNTSRQWLIRLLEEGSLPASSIPRAAKTDISNINMVGFIRLEKSGTGAKYSIADEASVRVLLQSSGYEGDLEGLTPKAKAVALHGDAHKGRDDALLITMSTAANAMWTDGHHTLDVLNHVTKFNIASLMVRPGDKWHTTQPVGLVENLDLVLYGKQYFEKIGFQGSVIYYSGWLSKALLDWLSETRRAPSYVIFADYDLVGIKNYLLAKAKLGESLSIYIPENLPELLRRFGNPEKLKSKSSRTLIESSGDPDVILLYQALLESGCGLDQESLLLL
ncbi:MAG: hypothetical protein RPU34_05305 [Candidatus Sedimenticola sp. (ex Thyasira tokunagai)]